MKFRNFTPHTVNIFDEAGEKIILSIEPEKNQVRVDEEIIPMGKINGIPVVEKIMGRVIGLPAEIENIVYIVSVIVLHANNRDDVVCPDTGPESVVRNEHGQVMGVRRFMA